MEAMTYDQMVSATQYIAQAQTTRRPPPFDNRVSMLMDGHEVRFLVDPYAERYIVRPTIVFPQGMLPPEDFDVMAAVFQLRQTKNALRSMGLLKRLGNWDAFARLKRANTQAHLNLIAIAGRSRVHRAAMQRIYHSASSPLREMLLPYACR